jgi:hypothetical protein
MMKNEITHDFGMFATGGTVWNTRTYVEMGIKRKKYENEWIHYLQLDDYYPICQVTMLLEKMPMLYAPVQVIYIANSREQ